jgi:hypothetical protein
MLSDVEKPSLIVVIRSGGGACCARHVMDEKFLYEKTLEKLKKKLGSKLGTEIPVPRYQDLIHLNYGSSAGNVVSSALAMGRDLDDVIDWWPKIGPDIVPIAQKKRQLLLRQAASFLLKYAASENGKPSHLDEKVMKILARFGASLTHIFAANENLLPNNGWDKHLRPLGFFDRTMRDSQTSVVYGAHYLEEGRPVYFGFIRPELLSAEYAKGLLLNGTDISHAMALKGATAIPFIFAPVEVAPGKHAQDLATVDGPYNFMSWVATDLPLSPKYGSIKVLHMGSGDRYNGSDPGVLLREGPIAAYGVLHKGMRNHLRRAAFATICRSIRKFNDKNGYSGTEPDFFNLDIPDTGRDFTDTSMENILAAMGEDAETSRRVNGKVFESLSSLLADNYIRECTFDRTLALAHDHLMAEKSGVVLLERAAKEEQKPDEDPDVDINAQMGSYGPKPEYDDFMVGGP